MHELIRLIKHGKIKALFMAKTHNTFIQLFRYIFVGSLAGVIDLITFWLFYQKLGLFEYTAVALSFLCGLIVNYILSIFFVFVGIGKDHTHSIKFSVYFTVAVFGLAFTEGFMLLFDEILGLHYMLAKIITTIITFLWNFGSKKIILYRKRDDE